MIFVTKFHDYKWLIIILSFQIIFKTLSIEWVYTVYEDFLYITVRAIVIQIISLLLMFAFVKDRNDLYIYVIIVTLASGGSSIYNFIHVRKYTKFKFTYKLNLKSHLKPIMLIFATSVAVTIYVNSDITILGFLCDDWTVGIYSVSVKVYTIIKQVVISILSVVIPRLAYFLGQNESEKFEETVNELFQTLITIVLPAVVGIYMLAKQIVYIVGGEEFIDASSSMQLLSIALIFCLYAWSWGQCILITFKQEKVLFWATCISAVVNVVLNIVLIPLFYENAAAFTTIMAEAISFIIIWTYGRKYVKLNKMTITYFKVFVGCLGIIIVNLLLNRIQFQSVLFHTFIAIVVSVIVYFIIELVLKNHVIYGLILQIKRKVK